MNTPTVKTQHQSSHHKYRDFSIKRMNKLLNIYNNTIHSATNHTPAQMEQNPQLETEYITEKLYQLERRRKQKDFELKPDTYVRYILPKDPHNKTRFKVSPEAYRISQPQKLKFSSSFGNNNGTVQEILNYNPRTHKYTVLFSMPDGSTYEDIIHESFLRGATPQIQSPIEREFRQSRAE